MSLHENAVEAHSLTKRYGEDILAVDDLNLVVRQGEIYALLGPNGAGKTTTVSMLMTLVQPSSGTAMVAGYDVVAAPEAVRERIGVTFQEIVLDPALKGREVLTYHGRLYGLSRADCDAQIAALLELVELEDAADRYVKHYSGGMKRRLELARGLMTRPDILFLDEPTQGLDPQNRAKVWEYLRTLRRDRGLTILMTTHYMEEAEALADRVGIIDQGRLVIEGTPAELVADMGADSIRVAGSGDVERFVTALGSLAFVEAITQTEGEVRIGVDAGNHRLPDIVGAAMSAEFQIEDISVARPSLGDVFLKYTGYALRDT